MLLMSHMQKPSYRASGNGFIVDRGNFDLCQQVLSVLYRVTSTVIYAYGFVVILPIPFA